MLGLSNEVEAWAKAEAPPELALPAPNPFLPKDLSPLHSRGPPE